ncbi:ABC transporter permease [Streptomyces sp. LX-29]|uniref:ABC transporter permease n=1 Tax=Streptomyces sp. LX-29 TaxID=2900152 RepID=UPI00240D9E8A|nr:ABC transporter permease [Streptomyces sp. LX-29]WFB09580.1 ABC transporter permease [Streptomyces sp. LX-29]
MRSLTNGLARAAVRFKPSSFVGTFVALALAAFIVSACGILLETGIRASAPPRRYADAPVVVAADQTSHLPVGHGEDREDGAAPVPDRARLDAALLTTVARTPGVAAAAPDMTFPVRGDEEALTAHGWGAAPLTGVTLSAGAAPRGGEVVLDAAAARALGVRPGDRTALTTPAGDREVRVAGVARARAEAGPTVWFPDDRAREASGHSDRIDAILVRPTSGVTPDRLADRLKKALDEPRGADARAAAAARVHTGEDRGGAEESGLAGAKEMLVALGGSFGGIAAAVAVFTTAGTVALSIGQRGREFALLRAIGATPRQIRRSVATEALLVAPAAGALGCLPGIALAHWWFGQLKEKGAIPAPVELAVSWIPLVSAVGAGLLTSLLAGLIAARRPARIRPGQALGEAAVERLRPGWIRTPLGVAALAGGVALAGVAAHESGEDAANAALGVVMLFMLAVALLGPVIARCCAWLLGLPLRAGSAPAELASANSRANARRLASAITPIVLAMAFASTLVFLHTSEDHVMTEQRRAGIVADHVIGGPEGLPADTAARAAATPGVATAVGVLRTGVLVPVGSGADRWLESASAQGVSNGGRDLAAVQDLDVRTGRSEEIGRPGTVAVDALLARSARVKVGDRLDLRLPDGTELSPRVVATYGRGLGLSQVTLARAALAPHVTAAYDGDVLVRAEHGVDRAALAARLATLGEVGDADGYAAAEDEDRAVNAWANATMAAVLAGFATVSAANTLVMTVLDRRRELGTLRLVGSTRRQVLGMVQWEALLVAVAGIVLGTAIALATLVPMVRGMTGEDPYIPPLLYAAFAGATVAVGLAATSLPARAALRSAALATGGQKQ